MPLTGRAVRVRASPMEAAMAMANRAATTAASRAPGPVGGPDDLVLIRETLLREPLGGRTWRAALVNRGAALYAGVAIEIRFLDRTGAVVGRLVRRAERLAPGSELDLQSRLPAGAAAARVHALRWSAGGRPVEAGPGPLRTYGDGRH